MAARGSDDRYRPKLFYEDVVSRQKVGLIQYGVVVASFLESDDEDDEDFEPQVKLKRGHVRVTWYPDGQREVVPEAKLHLVDRSLMPRDFVRRHAAGQDSQGGTVLNTDITVDLQIIGTNKVIPGVNSKKLKPLQRILPYEYVVYGVWLGRVRDVNAHLILRLSNGARCSMWVGDAAQLEDIRVQSDAFWEEEHAFYPGQTLMGPAKAFKDVEWLSGRQPILSSKAKFKVTVEDLVLKEVNVEWQTRGFSPPKKQPSELEEDLKPPEAAIQGDNINNLRKPEHFMYTHITFGDRAVYTLTEEDLGKVQILAPPSMTKEANQPDESLDDVAKEKTKGAAAAYELAKLLSEEAAKAIDFAEKKTREASQANDRIKEITKEAFELIQQAKEKANDVPAMQDSISKLAEEFSGSKTFTEEALQQFLMTKSTLENVYSTMEEAQRKSTEIAEAMEVTKVKSKEAAAANEAAKIKSREASEASRVVKQMSQEARKAVEKVEGEIRASKRKIEKSKEEKVGADTSGRVQGRRERRQNESKQHDTQETGSSKSGTDNEDDTEASVLTGAAVANTSLNRVDLSDNLNNTECSEQEERDMKTALLESERLKNDNHEREQALEGASGGPMNDSAIDHPELFTQACELSSSIVAKCDTLGGAVSEFCSGLNGIMADISGTLELVNKVEKDLSPQAQDHNSVSESGRLKSGAIHANGFSESQSTNVKLVNGEVDSDGQLVASGASGETIPSSTYNKAAGDSSNSAVLEDKDFNADDEEDVLTDDDNADSECSSSTASSRSSKSGKSKRLGVTLGVKTLKKAHRRVKKKKKRGAHQEWGPGDVVPVEVVNVSTLVDVMWQDSTIEHGIPANELAPIQHCDEHEFCPGDFIVDKRVSPKKDVYGFVRTVDHKARTCQIQWQEAAPGHPQGFLTHEEEEVSAYDLGDHPDYTYRIGDLVVRIADSTQAACRTPTSEKPCIGQVLRTNGDGSLAVVWIDNSVSSVPPQDLYRVDSEDEGGWSGDDSEWESVDSDEDWETDSDPASGDEVDGKVKSAEKPKEKKKDRKESTTSSSATKPSQEQRGAARNQEPAEEVISPEQEVMSPGQEVMSPGQEVMSPCSQVQEAKWVSAKGEGFSVSETCPACHRFKDLDFGPANMKNFFSNIKKELTLLSTSLPEGILVKTFEDRMDLFSVAIKGPHNTPYEDGLFLFDLKLPDAYPLIPPLLHYLAYHSGRLNPNLYEDGKVCVSLLGTWQGKGTEKWTKDSNLLQVLVSIQGLILVSEPYYNEAGFEKDKGSQEGLENSRCYNEMALLKMVQTMSKMALNPPDIFQDEIVEHYRQHGHRMIRRLESWLEMSESYSPNGTETKTNSDAAACSTNSETTSSQHQLAAAASNHPLVGQSSTNSVTPSDGIDQPKTTMLPKTDQSVLSENQPLTNRDQPRTSSEQAVVTSIIQQPTCKKHTSTTTSNQSDQAETGDSQLGINVKNSKETDSHQSSVDASKVLPTTVSMSASEVHVSDSSSSSEVDRVVLPPSPPGFPLFPLSKGFRMSLRSHLLAYRSVLHKLGIYS
ncbi:PREDICTED: (E3-independent) E2 ubiquitin-conjugating enzyme-like [Branchiostoma belcheri]|uniref:E2/E3 hybrid ubiquitin-protein ligase UBE2O n=1 Tax=Branchiostoma belcheri TaxID=7741 RepID=A0A6P5AKV9_BRABE|nr:PREDICTED: (E3-independent) E2 ubiquitin-conjugating enzyme-like [Branchiostoma belcheri]